MVDVVALYVDTLDLADGMLECAENSAAGATEGGDICMKWGLRAVDIAIHDLGNRTCMSGLAVVRILRIMDRAGVFKDKLYEIWTPVTPRQDKTGHYVPLTEDWLPKKVIQQGIAYVRVCHVPTQTHAHAMRRYLGYMRYCVWNG
jgi:hypothetical protein